MAKHAPNNITCWIALDDADAENGALRYIAGSHRDTLGLSVDEEGRLEDMDRLLAEGDQHVAAVRAGGAVFHHCLTIHGSAPNNSDRIRRAHSIIFMQPGTRCGRKPPFNSRPPTEGDAFDVSFGHPLLRTGKPRVNAALRLFIEVARIYRFVYHAQRVFPKSGNSSLMCSLRAIT